MSEQTPFLDAITKIRKARNITLQQLIANVTSERSYRRYLSGSYSMSLITTQKIVDKLKLSFIDIFSFYRKEPITQVFLVKLMHAYDYGYDDLFSLYITKLEQAQPKEKGIIRFKLLVLSLINKPSNKVLGVIKDLQKHDNHNFYHNPFEIAIAIEKYNIYPQKKDALLIANRLLNARHERMIDELFLRELFRFLRKVIIYKHLENDFILYLYKRYAKLIDLVAERHIRYEAKFLEMCVFRKPITIEDVGLFNSYSLSIPKKRVQEDIQIIKQLKNIDI